MRYVFSVTSAFLSFELHHTYIPWMIHKETSSCFLTKFPIKNVFINVCSWKSMLTQYLSLQQRIKCFFKFIATSLSLILPVPRCGGFFVCFLFSLYPPTCSEHFQLQATSKQYLKVFRLMFLAASETPATFQLWHPTWQCPVQPTQYQLSACVKLSEGSGACLATRLFSLAHLQWKSHLRAKNACEI